MVADWLFIPLFFATGLVLLSIGWWIRAQRERSEQRFTQLVNAVWMALANLTGATFLLVCKLALKFGTPAMMFASAAVMMMLSLSALISMRLPKWSQEWYRRQRNKCPDFAEDDEGNPVRGHTESPDSNGV